MAGKSTERPEIEELIRASELARGNLGTKVATLRRSLEVPSRIAGSVRHHPKLWFVGSMAAGLATSLVLGKLPGSGRKKGRSLKKKALALTLTAVRPVAKVWLANKLKSLGKKWVAERVSASSASPFQIEPRQNPSDVRTPGP